jgi:sulfate transport system permease protein
MAGSAKRVSPAANRKPERDADGRSWMQRLLILMALGFVVVFLLLPLVNVFWQALRLGALHYARSLMDPDTVSAIRLTAVTAAICVPLNLVFGLAASWAIAKFSFRGKPLLITLIDLPFSISPVVAGLLFVMLFGRQGLFGPLLEAGHLRIIFAVPGIVIATLFVTFPFVARELIPVMQAAGTDQEQAALTLGASGWTTFWHVTLPSVKWGLLYGVILCNARAMGEFGAVAVVSGHILGETETMPLRVETLHMSATMASGVAAFAVASLLAVLALLTLAFKSYLEWHNQRELERAQGLVPANAQRELPTAP